jgi:hypothetical protein
MRNALIAVIAFAAHAPLAASEPSAGRNDPANPEAPVPAVQYESAFQDYRGFRETPLAPWREVNDEVARVGGHLGILRAGRDASGTAPGTAQPLPSPAPAAPRSSPGAGHR